MRQVGVVGSYHAINAEEVAVEPYQATNSEPNSVESEEEDGEGATDTDGLLEVSGTDTHDAGVFKKKPFVWLPKTAYGKGIRALIKSSETAETYRSLPLGLLCGPAVLSVRRGAAVLWGFWFLLPIAAYFSEDCPNAAEGCELWTALLPPWWLKWCVFAPVVFVTLWIEEECLGYVIPIQLQTTKYKDFKFLGGLVNFSNWNYYFWRIMMLGLSLAGKSSIYANTIFVVRVWKIEECRKDRGETEVVEAIWAHVGKASFIGNTPPFWFLVLLMWLLMGLQIIYALLHTLPLGKKVEFSIEHGDEYSTWETLSKCRSELKDFPVEYEVPKSMGFADTKGKHFQYATFWDPCQNHGAAVNLMADAGRMAALTFQDHKFAEVKMETMALEILHGTAKSDTKFNYLHIATHQLGHQIGSFLMVGLLECAFQVNVQISFMGILSKVANDNCLELMTGMAIGLNVLKMSEKLVAAHDVRKLLSKLKAEVATWRPEVDDIPADLDDEDGIEQNRIEREWRNVKWQEKQFYVYAVLYFLALSYAGCKLIAYTVCEDHMFNVTGCVDFSDMPTPTPTTSPAPLVFSFAGLGL